MAVIPSFRVFSLEHSGSSSSHSLVDGTRLFSLIYVHTNFGDNNITLALMKKLFESKLLTHYIVCKKYHMSRGHFKSI